MIVDTEQLVSQSQALQLVRQRPGMEDMSARLLAYYLSKPGAPQPLLVAGKRVYLKDKIAAWHPEKTDTRGRKKGKNKRNSPGGGGS